MLKELSPRNNRIGCDLSLLPASILPLDPDEPFTKEKLGDVTDLLSSPKVATPGAAAARPALVQRLTNIDRK